MIKSYQSQHIQIWQQKYDGSRMLIADFQTSRKYEKLIGLANDATMVAVRESLAFFLTIFTVKLHFLTT